MPCLLSVWHLFSRHCLERVGVRRRPDGPLFSFCVVPPLRGPAHSGCTLLRLVRLTGVHRSRPLAGGTHTRCTSRASGSVLSRSRPSSDLLGSLLGPCLRRLDFEILLCYGAGCERVCPHLGFRRCGDPSLLPSPHDGSAFLEASLLFVHFLGTPSLPPVLLPSGDGNAFLAGHICAPATHVARFRQLSCPPFCRLPNAVGLRAIRNVISGFIRGDVDPQRDAWLILQVVKKGDRLISMDNRRLRCLHEWQRQAPSQLVLARIRVEVWNQCLIYS